MGVFVDDGAQQLLEHRPFEQIQILQVDPVFPAAALIVEGSDKGQRVGAAILREDEAFDPELVSIGDERAGKGPEPLVKFGVANPGRRSQQDTAEDALPQIRAHGQVNHGRHFAAVDAAFGAGGSKGVVFFARAGAGSAGIADGGGEHGDLGQRGLVTAGKHEGSAQKNYANQCLNHGLCPRPLLPAALDDLAGQARAEHKKAAFPGENAA